MSEMKEKLIDDWNNKFSKFELTESFPCGEKYPHYELRELMKEIAWGVISECKKTKDYNTAAWFLLHGIITSHYYRARESLEFMDVKDYEKWMKKIRGKKYYKHYLLDIDHYTNHWLWANGDRDELFPKEVVEKIEENFGYKPEECKYLPKGYSEYR